jgi:hypothetical protein
MNANTKFLTETLENQKYQPKYRYDLVKKYAPSFINISTKMWTYFRYAGLLKPWHDNPDILLYRYSTQLYDLIEWLTNENVTIESYSIFSLSIATPDRFESPVKLFWYRADKSWIKKLRKYSETHEMMDYSAYILMRFFEKQIEHTGRASIAKSSILRRENPAKAALCLEGYYRLVDRVRQLVSMNIHPEVWLTEKFDNCVKAFPKEAVKFRTIVNLNGLEPNLDALKIIYSDPWREIKKFIGLSPNCQITDGYLPKGWSASTDDLDDLTKIVRITGDGYYYYPDGTQRRGRRHYSGNSYFVIKCDPSNFQEFKASWFDVRLLSVAPTFDEYLRYAAYPGMWDQDGKAVNERGKPIRWRKA